MADVRSMLKASREARRINHPYASYTSDGKLLCNLCETLIKSDAAWQGHLHSTQHTVRQTRAKEAAEARGANGAAANKKRKADASPEDSKKKMKATMVENGEEDEKEEVVAVRTNGKNATAQRQEVDERPADAAELADFEQQLLQMEASMPKQQVAPTISAPAMSAEELAAQAREEQSTQREKRAAEQEAEKEDAARVLEDEFEEMEGLEARARKLRERREMLRKGKSDDANGTSVDAGRVEVEPEANVTAEGGAVEDEDDDEDDDEDFDEWNFGAR